MYDAENIEFQFSRLRRHLNSSVFSAKWDMNWALYIAIPKNDLMSMLGRSSMSFAFRPGFNFLGVTTRFDSHVTGSSSGSFSVMGPMSVAFISSHLSNFFISFSSKCTGGGLYFYATGSTVLSMFNFTYLCFLTCHKMYLYPWIGLSTLLKYSSNFVASV